MRKAAYIARCCTCPMRPWTLKAPAYGLTILRLFLENAAPYALAIDSLPQSNGGRP